MMMTIGSFCLLSLSPIPTSFEIKWKFKLFLRNRRSQAHSRLRVNAFSRLWSSLCQSLSSPIACFVFFLRFSLSSLSQRLSWLGCCVLLLLGDTELISLSFPFFHTLRVSEQQRRFFSLKTTDCRSCSNFTHSFSFFLLFSDFVNFLFSISL